MKILAALLMIDVFHSLPIATNNFNKEILTIETSDMDIHLILV